MPANQKELSPQISPELLESPDQRPRSSSLNSLVSDVSVAGSEAVLETSSEGDSNAVFVQSAQNSILPKPPTPTVAPMMSSPVSNIFLPIKDPEEEINIPSQDPTIEDLNAQELFKNIAQLTLSAQESIDFSGTFKSAVNKERLSNVGKSVMDMTKSKKLEFFKALSNSTGTNNQTSTIPNQVNVQGHTISPKAQSKEPPKMQTNLNINNKSGLNSKPTASERVAVIPPAVLDINTNVNLLNLTTKNGNAIQPSVVSCNRPLSPKYDIPFPEDLPPKSPSPRPQNKTPSPRPHLKKQIPPPRPPPISVPQSIDSNQDLNLPKSELIQTQDSSSSKSSKNEFDNRPKPNFYNQIEESIVPSSPSTVVERYSDKVYSDKVPIITQQSSITGHIPCEDIGTPPSTPLSKQALNSSSVTPSVQQNLSKHSKAKESTTSRFLGMVSDIFK